MTEPVHNVTGGWPLTRGMMVDLVAKLTFETPIFHNFSIPSVKTAVKDEMNFGGERGLTTWSEGIFYTMSDRDARREQAAKVVDRVYPKLRETQ